MGLLSKKSRNLAYLVGGMGGLLGGGKVLPLALFAKGMHGMEQVYREEKSFSGSWSERWTLASSFYDATHKHPVNRVLHVVGIPMIVGGAAGMIAWPRFTPPWAVSAASFTAGWGLNFIGHGFYEKNAPAFADDPLSFIAGPAWDAQQLPATLCGLLSGGSCATESHQVETPAPPQPAPAPEQTPVGAA
jgi:hypothetical protein